jgi:PmbA protein
VTDADDLAAMAAGVADRAGSSEQIDVMVARSRSTSVRVFEGEVEAFTSARTAGVGVRVIVGGKVGFAHAGSLEPDVLDDVLREARENVEFAEVDEFAGLADPDGVEAVHHDHWNQAVVDLAPERKIELALELERRTRSLDDRVSSVRIAAWSDGAGEVAYATSGGVVRSDRGTSCSVGVQPLARSNGETQIGYGSDAARDPDDIDLEKVAKEAVERATRLLGSTKPPSARLSILLDPRLVASLLGIVSGMLDGESVIKGRSPFAGRVGEAIASPLLTLVDDPTRTESLGADSWDGEGLACRRNALIDGGRLQGFLHNSWTARRSGAASTGSAVRGARSAPGVGARVLVLEPGDRSFEELVASIDLGLYVNSFAGLHSGVNPVSGDFSVGSDGVMIRNGSLAEPVREVTIASTLQRLLLDIAQVGGDAEWLPGGDYLASLVIDDVSMGGS